MSNARHRSLAAAVAVVLAARLCGAQPVADEAARRRTLIADAEGASQRGDHDLALRHATAAADLQWTPSLGMFIAEEALAARQYRLAQSQGTRCWDAAAADATINHRDRIIEHCRGVLARLDREVAWLRLRGLERAPDDTRIVVDGEEIPRALWGTELPTRPGSIRVSASAQRGPMQEQTLRVEAGAHDEVTFQWGELSAAPADRAPALRGAMVQTPGPGPWPTVLIGVGAASLIAALTVHLTIENDRRSVLENTTVTFPDGSRATLCNGNFCWLNGFNESTSKTYVGLVLAQNARNALIGVGGAAVVSGVLWAILGRSRTVPVASLPTVHAGLLPGGFGLTVGGSM